MKTFIFRTAIYCMLTLLVSCQSATGTEVAHKQEKVVLNTKQELLIENLHTQILTTTSYNPAYVSIAYPNGDVDKSTGVCADVVIRALRAIDIDLQQEIHEDISRHFSVYPKIWKMSAPDKNIDHRRVPNIMCFLQRKGKAMPMTQENKDYHPGDIVAWKLDNGLYHIGMVSENRNEENTPLIIHNIGRGTQEADLLFRWKIIGHYRYY